MLPCPNQAICASPHVDGTKLLIHENEMSVVSKSSDMPMGNINNAVNPEDEINMNMVSRQLGNARNVNGIASLDLHRVEFPFSFEKLLVASFFASSWSSSAHWWRKLASQPFVFLVRS
jgi:hypothetical protein